MGDLMLDAYIIERIRERQDRQREDARIPLHIERPEHNQPVRADEEPSEQRGIVEIDFSI